MNKKQLLLGAVLFCGLIQQNALKASSIGQMAYIPSTDKQECKILRKAILSLLFKYKRDSTASLYYYQEGYMASQQNDAQHYVDSMIKMYESMKCNRFENNFDRE
jgi:hypothetical protein